MRNRKGQGLPLNTIIIAIIVIVVLVVIILITTGQLGNFQRTIASCPAGQQCQSANECADAGGRAGMVCGVDANQDPNRYCCTTI